MLLVPETGALPVAITSYLQSQSATVTGGVIFGGTAAVSDAAHPGFEARTAAIGAGGGAAGGARAGGQRAARQSARTRSGSSAITVDGGPGVAWELM